MNLIEKLEMLGVKVTPVKHKPSLIQFPKTFETARQVQKTLELCGFTTFLSPQRATAISSPVTGQMRSDDYVAFLPPEVRLKGKLVYSRVIELRVNNYTT